MYSIMAPPSCLRNGGLYLFSRAIRAARLRLWVHCGLELAELIGPARTIGPVCPEPVLGTHAFHLKIAWPDRSVQTNGKRSKLMSQHFCRLIYFYYILSFVKERHFQSSDAVTSISYLWLVVAHRSLIPKKFNLKINRSMKTPWQEYSGVAYSYSSSPVCTYCLHQVIK